MGRWRDQVAPVKAEDASRAKSSPKGFGFLKQSVAGLVGRSQDPSSPKRTWFGLGSRPRASGSEPPAPEPDLEGGSSGALSSSTAPTEPGTTPEDFAVASQLLEGLYGKRLSAPKALEILTTVPEISWLVECYCMTPAQPGWRKSKVAPGDVPLYCDEGTGKVYEAMPCMRHYMRLAELALTARNLPEKAEASAAQLHHYVQSLKAELKSAEAAWTGPHEDAESQGHYYHNPSTGVSTWESPTSCTTFILTVAEQLQESDAFPQREGRTRGSKDTSNMTSTTMSRVEDPWISLDKLEAMGGASQIRKDVDIEAFISTLSGHQDSSGPSGLEPVQLPSMQKPRDLRSWQPQVPRFDAQNLGETSSPSSKQLSVPFRSVARGGEAKLGDVRDWQPSVTRWEQGQEGGEATVSGGYEEGQLRQTAEASGDPAKPAPLPPVPTEAEAAPTPP